MNFEKLFNRMPQSAVIISPEYRILAVTEAYLHATRRTREDLLGKHLMLEAFPNNEVPYEQNPVKLGLEKAIVTKQPYISPIIKYDIEGEVKGEFEQRYWQVSSFPQFTDAGQLEFIIHTAQDVTEREIARLQQIESEQKFRFIADSLPQLIDTNDADGNLTYFNKRWTDYTGIPEEELIAEGWERSVHPDDLDNANKVWNTSFDAGVACQVELRIRDKEGSYRWFLNRYLPMRNELGDITLWLCSCTDIHSTKLMVEELLESNTQMALLSDQVELAYKKAEAERKTLVRLIDKAPAFFCILKGPEHRYELVNRKYQQLFPGRNLLHKTVAEALPEVAEQGFIQILDNVYNTGEEFVANDILVQIAPSDGAPLEDRYFTFIYQTLLDENEQAEGILVSGFEVTEMHTLRQLLKQ